MPNSVLRLGTRASLLAQAQSRLVAALLEQRHPSLRVELTLIKTSGDQITHRPLHELGGKGLFTKELEHALLARTIDFAVHSFKDVPVTMPLVAKDNLIVAATPRREDARDVLASLREIDLRRLPARARVATGSLRRRCQVLALRPDLVVSPIRGNIDTRLRKLREGECDALLLAAAGLNRARLFDPSMMRAIDVDEMLPAPGQGALALQCRRDDHATRERLHALDDSDTSACVSAERELVRLLEADCHSPIAAFAEGSDGMMRLRALVGSRGGELPVLKSEASGDPHEVVTRVFHDLSGQGAIALLRGN